MDSTDLYRQLPFEALAVDVLLSTDVKKAATILCITWDEAWHIME